MLVKENNLKSVHCFIPIGNEIDVRSFIELLFGTIDNCGVPKNIEENSIKASDFK